MRIPVALYPYHSDLLPLVKHFEDLQNKYHLVRITSPPGLSLTGKDASYARNHPNIGMTVTDMLNAEDNAWDILLLAKPDDPDIADATDLEDTMEKALQAGKTVFYYDSLTINITEKMQMLSKKYINKVHFFTGGIDTQVITVREQYTHISIPVILVGGLLAEADVFEVLCCLAARLRADNMRPLVLARQKIGNILDFSSISHIFDNTGSSESQKIMEMNKYIRQLMHYEVPDLILVEAPDAVMRYSDSAPNGFGIQTYLLCQAVEPDLFVCCVSFNNAVGELMEKLSEDFRLRLGTCITAIHASNQAVDAYDSAGLTGPRISSFVYNPLSVVNDYISRSSAESDIPFYNIISDKADRLYSHLREALS